MTNKLTTMALVALMLTTPIADAQSPTEESLLGTWRCDAVLHASLYESDKSRFTAGWEPEKDGLTVTLKNVNLNFKSNDGAFTLATSAPNPFVISSTEALTSPFRVIAGQLALRYTPDGVNYFYEIRRADEARLELVPQAGTVFPTLSCGRIAALGHNTP